MKLHSLRDSRSSVEWIPVFQYMWMWMWSNPLTNQPSRGTLQRRHPAHKPAMIRWYLEKEAGYLDWVGGTPPTFAVAAVRCGGSQKSVVLIAAATPGGNEILDVLRSGVHILSHIPPIQKHLANICSTSVVVVCGFCDIRAGLCELAMMMRWGAYMMQAEASSFEGSFSRMQFMNRARYGLSLATACSGT